MNEDPSSLTLKLVGEDHTVGNALRAMLCSRAEVDFAGYSQPHPTDDSIVVRVQTVQNKVALDAVDSALQDLMAMTIQIEHAFQKALDGTKVRSH